VFEQCAHVVCEGCGAPGIARVAAARHPRDVEVTCPECGHTTVVACAGLGPIWTDPGEPDMPVEEETWLHRRRRMIGVASGRAPTGDWYGDDR
jgi:hypothetical protein